eukprot:8753573-Heterocapsa_arctica.AAC.1
MSAPYQDRLNTAWAAFRAWNLSLRLPGPTTPIDDAKRMDSSFEKYIQFLYNSGKQVTEATMT